MRRRNRKLRQANNFSLPARFTGAVILLSAAALIYVWLGCRCESLGRDLKRMELYRAELDKRLVNEEYRWARMKSPRNIEKALEQHGLSMAWPRRDQIVRLRHEDVFDKATEESDSEALTYAQNSRVGAR